MASWRRELDMNSLPFLAFPYNIANMDCNVELSGGGGGAIDAPRLDPDLREKLLTLCFDAGADPESVRKGRPRPLSRSSASSPSHSVGLNRGEEIRELVFDLARKTFGPDVMLCRAYPNARSPDILCCLTSTVAVDPSFPQSRLGIKGGGSERALL